MTADVFYGQLLKQQLKTSWAVL